MLIILLCTLSSAVPTDTAVNDDQYPLIGFLPEIVVTAKRIRSVAPDAGDLPAATHNDVSNEPYLQERLGLVSITRFFACNCGFIILGLFTAAWILLLLARMPPIFTGHAHPRFQTVPLHSLLSRNAALKPRARGRRRPFRDIDAR